MLPIIKVSAGILQNMQGQILMATRPMGKSCAGQWEFSGGKIEPHETPVQALYRELQEEIGVTIDTKTAVLYHTVKYDYPDFHLYMPVFWCCDWTGVPTANEGQLLQWVNIATLHTLNVVTADIPLIQKIQKEYIK